MQPGGIDLIKLTIGTRVVFHYTLCSLHGVRVDTGEVILMGESRYFEVHTGVCAPNCFLNSALANIWSLWSDHIRSAAINPILRARSCYVAMTLITTIKSFEQLTSQARTLTLESLILFSKQF